MNFGIYSIYDRVSGCYGEPYYSVNEGVAVRRFKYICDNADMVAPDCSLYKLGDFDNVTGDIVPIKPVFICNSEVE